MHHSINQTTLMEKFWHLAFVSLVTLACITKIIHNTRRYPRRKLPPGPKPWPIIGNLNLLGSIPHQSFHKLSQKHGGMMLLRFGKFPVVVASSPETAKEFLKVHDAVFASRPALAAGKFINFNYSDMVWGPHWKQARKICASEVFNAKKLDSFEEIRVEERRNLFRRIRSLKGKPVVLRDQLLHLTLSTVSRIVFGSKYFCEREEEKPFVKLQELQAMVDEWFFLNGVFNVGDWIPWLSFLDLQGYVKRMKDLANKIDGFFECMILDHQARRINNEDVEQLDMVDALLQQADNPNLEVPLTRDCIKGLLMDLLIGGTDTSATTVEWAIYEMMRQPRIMQKAKDEVDRVIGRNRWVEEKDCSELPYTDAIIMESFRLHPLATLLAPHYAAEDCKVSGYDIEKGTTVLVNTWSIGRDPNSWPDAPQDFIPERFMGRKSSSCRVEDMLGSNFALLPFGSGRRRCPGYNLGLKVVRTTLANLLHGFEFKLVEGMRGEDICMEETYGLTTHPKHALSIIMDPTLPPHLY